MEEPDQELRYILQTPAHIRCSERDCMEPVKALCWNCGQAACASHLLIAVWQVYEAKQCDYRADSLLRGRQTAGNPGALVCTTCVRKFPTRSGVADWRIEW